MGRRWGGRSERPLPERTGALANRTILGRFDRLPGGILTPRQPDGSFARWGALPTFHSKFMERGLMNRGLARLPIRAVAVGGLKVHLVIPRHICLALPLDCTWT